MEMSTVGLLADLNRRFYEEHAEDFADTRPRLQAGVRRVLKQIPAGAHVLEVGCGDGKVGRALPHAAYTGLDQSAALLRRAADYTTEDEKRRTQADLAFAGRSAPCVFMHADLLSADGLPDGPFDWALAFAVFHHLPGEAARLAVMRRLAQRLAPGGRVGLSNWQFHTSPRLLSRQAPWPAVGLTEADVEPGDALLTWERKGRHGLRYVHALPEAEARALLTGAGLTVIDVYTADGHSSNLAQYVVAQRAER